MRLRRPWLEELIFGKEVARRFTQDSPVYRADNARSLRVDLADPLAD